MKKIILFVLVLLLLPFSALAQVDPDEPRFEIFYPTEREYVSPGDTITIKWKAYNFEPSNYHGINVFLSERTFKKRIRTAFVSRPSNNGVYEIDWTIPEDFFKYKVLENRPHYFRIDVKAHTGEDWIKATSYKSMYLISPLSNTPMKEVNNVVKTEVDVMEEETEKVSTVIPEGSQFVAKYSFKSLLEPWVVKRVTAVNDTDDDGFDYDLSETTNVIDKVYVRFPNAKGDTTEAQAAMVNGKAVFSNLDFYIPKNEEAFLELWTEPLDKTSAQQSFSGSTFRIGLQDTGNDSSSFEAVAQITSTVKNTLSGFSLSSGTIHKFVVRESVLAFDVKGEERRDLFAGEPDPFEFTISGNSIRLGRIVLDVNQTGLTSLGQFQLFRGSSLVTPGDASSKGKVYLMWDSGGSSCFAHTQQSGAGTGMDCNGNVAASSKLIIAFSEEEIVSGDQTYKLRFNVTGVDIDDRITIRLNDDDDFAEPLIAGSSNFNGEIHNGGLGNELFTGPSTFFTEATTLTNRNIIWSDSSADFHQYPTVLPGNPPTLNDQGSADWTNGYLLKINAEPAVTWIRD